MTSTAHLVPAKAASALAERRALMLHGPIVPTLFKLTFPVITVVVTQTFVAILEAYWVSRLGTEAVAGVSLVLPLLILMGTMSNGGIGGGVSSAVARAIGADRQADADALLLHTAIIALAFGLAFTLCTMFLGPRIYSSLGGRGPTLQFALTYSAWVFGGAPLIWTVNLLGSAMLWPFLAGGLRLAVTVTGAAWLAHNGAPLSLIVAPVAVGSVLFGMTNAAGFFWNAKRLVAAAAGTVAHQSE